MRFTDEDLKRFKEKLPEWKDHAKSCGFLELVDDLIALLARLELAEACMAYHECQDDLDACPHLAAWRKAAGK